MKRGRIFIFIFFVVLVEFLLVWVIRRAILREVDLRLQNETHEFKIIAESSIRSFNLVSGTIFSQIIDKEPVLKIFSRACLADSLEKNKIRAELYALLNETYNHLQSVNIKQLHFHLPNNESFLRFHRPGKYGDDLTEVRYSVRMTNKFKKTYQGFEEGRIYNGFRYVFPLGYKGKHIGSVETSFSFGGVSSELKAHGIRNAAFMIKRAVVNSKVFKDELSNYVPSLISDDYANEKQFLHYRNDSGHVMERIDRELAGKVSGQLAENKDFTILHKLDDQYYMVSFISIDNVEGDPVAYLVAYTRHNDIANYFRQSTLYTMLILVIVPLLLTLLYLYFDRSRKIREQNYKLKDSEDQLYTINEQLEAQARELKEKNEILHALNLSKERFNSIIAHDLKNPFNALIGFSELVSQESQLYDNPNLQKYCFLIRKTAKHSYDLLINLLHWSRIQTGRVDVDIKPLDLKELCLKVVNLLEINITEKQIALTMDIEQDLVIPADQDLFTAIIRNLLSNAIKYSFPGGEIILKAHTRKGEIHITVEDFGVGIPAEDIKKLFQPDLYFSTKGTNEEHGTGLGLNLCKEFVELHGGKISVDSKPNKGTKFLIVLKK